MKTFWYISGDFTKERSRRIGASDVPALIPNPEKPTESLAGYERTAVTVWEEKTGRREREPAGFPAEMGHYLEAKAIELFIRGIDRRQADEYFMERARYDILKARLGDQAKAAEFQLPAWRHNVQFYNEEFIVHPDTVYVPPYWDDAHDPFNPSLVDDFREPIKAHGHIIDLSRPFLIEAKSARFFAARRPEGSLVSGYDVDLKTWQGIPLKHYVQIQFQLALMEVEICYLPLIYDTSSFHVWEIRADKKIQGELIDLAGRMAWYIKTDTPPKELAMNAADVKALYPTLTEDFVYLSGAERDKALEYAHAHAKADRQVKIWTARKEEAADALAVVLKDRAEIRDEEGKIAGWVTRDGGERVKGAKEIKKEAPEEYNRLKVRGFIIESKPTRYVSVAKREIEEGETN